MRGQIARMNISFCASDRSALEFDEYIFLLGSSKSKRWHEEAAAIERDSGGGRS